MNRWIRGLAWGGAILFGCSALFTTWFDAITWPFLVAFVACITLLVWSWIDRRRLRATLPQGLRGLWYRTGRGRIEFHWRWTSGPERLRILRSELATIHDAGDGGLPGITRVADAHTETYAVDEGLAPGATGRYAFFVGYAGGRWSDPVRQTITALPAHETAYLEATLRPVPRDQRPSRAPSEWYSAWDDSPGFYEVGAEIGLATALAGAISGAVVDGVFDLLGTLPPDKLEREGWVEVV